MRFIPKSKALRLLAVVYAVKTLLIGIAWVVVPDLPERAASQVRQTWQRLSGHP